MFSAAFVSLISSAVLAVALAGGVVQVTDKSFKDEVMKHDGVVIVEFYAPW